MDRQISSVAKLGIVLVALAVLIGLAFGVFQISRGTADSGISDVQSELEQVRDSEFTDFDQVEINGTQVIEAAKKYANSNYAILIKTAALKAVYDENSSYHGENRVISSDGGIIHLYGNEYRIPLVPEYLEDEYENEEAVFINYGSLIGNSSEDAIGVTSYVLENGKDKYYTGGMVFNNGKFYSFSSYMYDKSGRVLHNELIKGLETSGQLEYINRSSKFSSYLLMDTSNTIIGIVFEQLTTV